jgi:8-oxo-dGTP pyrophosphatase MutT (NUDIX family)
MSEPPKEPTNDAAPPKGAHVVFHRLIKTRPICCQDSNEYKIHMIRAVLLCKRTTDAPIHPGSWSLIGGTVDNNESPRETAAREVAEELEIARDHSLDMKFLVDVTVSRRGGPCTIRYFESQLDADMDDLKLKRQQDSGKVENEGLSWFTAEEIHHLPMRPEDRMAVNKFFATHGV